jgi:hypothetical protein
MVGRCAYIPDQSHTIEVLGPPACRSCSISEPGINELSALVIDSAAIMLGDEPWRASSGADLATIGSILNGDGKGWTEDGATVSKQ